MLACSPLNTMFTAIRAVRAVVFNLWSGGPPVVLEEVPGGPQQDESKWTCKVSFGLESYFIVKHLHLQDVYTFRECRRIVVLISDLPGLRQILNR